MGEVTPHGWPSGVPFADFAAASEQVLQVLQDRLGMGLWMVTRAVGPDQVVLAARSRKGSGYDVTSSTVLRWKGSLCQQLVLGHGPAVAPRVADVSAYATAPNRQQVPVEAYVAVPLLQADGALFGTLCGFDAHPQPESLRGEEPLLVLQGRLLTTLLHLELEREQQQRRAERAESDATRDVLTGLANRRAWDRVLAAEEVRCQRYGHPATVLVVDLNGLKQINDSAGHAAGDRLLRDAAALLLTAARTSDVVARLGGDEFGLLAVEAAAEGGRATAERVAAVLASGGVEAAVGLGVRAPNGSLSAAWHEADRAMYEHKQAGYGEAVDPRPPETGVEPTRPATP